MRDALSLVIERGGLKEDGGYDFSVSSLVDDRSFWRVDEGLDVSDNICFLFSWKVGRGVAGMGGA